MAAIHHRSVQGVCQLPGLHMCMIVFLPHTSIALFLGASDTVHTWCSRCGGVAVAEVFPAFLPPGWQWQWWGPRPQKMSMWLSRCHESELISRPAPLVHCTLAT